MSENTSKKRKLSLPLIVAGGVSSLVLALGMSPTFSAFTASITNATNSAGAGTLTMQESSTTGTTVTCDSGLGTNASCTINKFTGNLSMYPGQTLNTTVTVKNTGSVPATSFSMTPDTTCTPADVPGASVHGTGDPCTVMTVLVKATAGTTTTNVVSGLTLSAFASGGIVTLPAPVAPGASVTMSFDVTLPSTATNAVQGRQASMPITFTFGA